MKDVYLFNPENDMALAYGRPRFMIRRSVRKMAADLSFLPAWYAGKGSAVWVDDVKRIEDFRKQCPVPIEVDFVTEIPTDCERIQPWGWNPSLCHALSEKGLLSSAYPSAHEMEQIRVLSHRATAVKVLKQLTASSSPYLTGDAVVLHSAAEIEQVVRSYGRAVLKAPWSGSGRGILFIADGGMEAAHASWVRRILLTQQAVIVEPFYSKKVDFAMEFHAGSIGHVVFAGYSLFETDGNGVYKRNVLASDEAIETYVSEWVPRQVLKEVREQLEVNLTETLHGAYHGYLGVDMMVCEDTPCKLHPCVEMNLRMNMGILSRMVFHRYIVPSSQGHYYIEYYPHEGEALQAHQRMQEEYPLQMNGGKIARGYFTLTPVAKDTACQVYAIIT